MKAVFKWIIVFLIAVVPFGIEAKSAKKSPRDALFELRQGLERVIASAEPSVHIGIEVVSLDNGQKIYEKNSNQLFTPASSQKIYTAAAALSLLGAEYRFETCLFSDGKVQDGVLQGNLYLKGSGNPELSVRDLEELLFQLKLLQIDAIQGDLVLDNFAFDGVAMGPGWMWDEEPAYWNAPMDALVVNHSCIDLWIAPAKANQPPRVFCFPRTDYVSIQNEAKTQLTPVKKLDITRSDSNQLEISGEVSLDYAPQNIHIPLNEPHLYVGHLLMEMLPKYGIKLSERLDHRPTPKGAHCLASHFSSPLSLLVRHMMKTSDNLYSDCIFKKLGEQKGGSVGSWKTGSLVIKEFLEKKAGIKISDFAVMDGSGQSRYNLSSAHHLVSALAALYQEKECFPEFFASFSVSGVDGCLRYRLQDEETKGRIRAKTGSMTGVSSLSGYVLTKGEELLAFSILLNGFTCPVADYKAKIEDQVCELLVNFSR